MTRFSLDKRCKKRMKVDVAIGDSKSTGRNFLPSEGGRGLMIIRRLTGEARTRVWKPLVGKARLVLEVQEVAIVHGQQKFHWRDATESDLDRRAFLIYPPGTLHCETGPPCGGSGVMPPPPPPRWG